MTASLDPEEESSPVKLKNKLVKLNAQNQLNPHDHFKKFQFPYVEKIEKDSKDQEHLLAIILLNKPLYSTLNSFFIGSRLEFGTESKSCRMAFSGRVIQNLMVEFSENQKVKTTTGTALSDMVLTKVKVRKGILERFNNPTTGILKDMFGKGSDLTRFVGKTVSFFGGKYEADFQGAFGKNGKFKVVFERNLSADEQASLIGQEGELSFIKQVQLIR